MRNSAEVLRAILVGLLAIAVVAIPGSDQVFAASGTWTTKAPMPTPRFVAGDVVNGVLYAVGGCTSGTPNCPLGTVEAYAPATNTWTTKAPMPTAREGLAVGVVNGVLYAVGGDNGAGILSTVEAYDPATNTWTTKAPMPTSRSFPAVGVVNGVLYAVGGAKIPTAPLGTVEAYDPVANTWTTKAPMPTARFGLAVGVVNGVLYAVGGFNGGTDVSTVEAYDPATNTWTTKTPMPTARCGLSAGVMNGVLYTVGGAQACAPFVIQSTVEAYNPTTNTWTTKTPMPAARYDLAVGVVNSVLYAAGGSCGVSCNASTNEAFTDILPFAAFSAKVDINAASSSFGVNSTFTLGSGGSINPLTQAVTFQLGGFSITIPAGSFHLVGKGMHFVFDGTVNGVALEANLTPLGGNSYSFKLEGAGAPNLPTSNLVTLGLTIGNNAGSVQVNTGGAGRPGGTLTGTVSGSFDSNNILGASLALSNGVTGTIHGAAPGVPGSLTLSNGITAVLTQSVSNGPITWTFSNGVTGVSTSIAGTSGSGSLTLSNGVQATFTLVNGGTGPVTITSGVGGTFVPFNP